MCGRFGQIFQPSTYDSLLLRGICISTRIQTKSTLILNSVVYSRKQSLLLANKAGKEEAKVRLETEKREHLLDGGKLRKVRR